MRNVEILATTCVLASIQGKFHAYKLLFLLCIPSKLWFGVLEIVGVHLFKQGFFLQFTVVLPPV